MQIPGEYVLFGTDRSFQILPFDHSLSSHLIQPYIAQPNFSKSFIQYSISVPLLILMHELFDELLIF